MTKTLARTLLLALAAGPALAAPALARDGEASFGVGAGTVDPQGFRRGLYFTANIRSALGRNFILEPEAGYWWRDESIPGVENKVSDANVGVNVLRRVGKGRSRLFVGAGLGLHVIRSSFEVAGFDRQSDTEVKQGLHLLAGFDHRLGGVTLFGAARWDIVTDLDQSKAYGGVRLGR